MNRPLRRLAAGILLGLSQIAAPPLFAASAAESADGDLRDIRIGMAVSELPRTGYTQFVCADSPERTLQGWENWNDCPAGAAGMHAVRFGYDAATGRDGTMVAGHPAVLTLLIDDAARVAGLQIETDPKARQYLRKKAFLLGLQAMSRYGSEGWACTEDKPAAGEQPVGGVYLKQRCTKTTNGRALIVERKLFRRADQDSKSFVDETRIRIMQSKG